MARENDSTRNREDAAAAAAHTTADDAVVTCEAPAPAAAHGETAESTTATEDVAAAEGVASIDRASPDAQADPVFGKAALKDLVVYHGPDAELKWDTDLGPSVRMAAIGFLLLLFLMGVFAGIIWWIETTGSSAPAAG
jgi:hypothetical protein